MPPSLDSAPDRERFNVSVEAIDDAAWHITVPDLPDTWTVAFSLAEVEDAVRRRIALDTGRDPTDFDLVLDHGPLRLERRSHQRD